MLKFYCCGGDLFAEKRPKSEYIYNDWPVTDFSFYMCVNLGICGLTRDYS